MSDETKEKVEQFENFNFQEALNHPVAGEAIRKYAAEAEKGAVNNKNKILEESKSKDIKIKELELSIKKAGNKSKKEADTNFITKDDYDAKLSELTQQYDLKLNSALSENNEKLETEVRQSDKLFAETQLDKALTFHRADPEDKPLLKKSLLEKFKVSRAEDGRQNLEILGLKDTEKFNAQGDPVSISDYISRYRDEHPKYFLADLASGGSTLGGSNSVGGSKFISLEASQRMSLADYQAFKKAGGQIKG